MLFEDPDELLLITDAWRTFGTIGAGAVAVASNC